MTSKNTTRATDIDPSDPQSVLRATDWTALEHARGPATDAPEMLIALLDTDQGIRTKALGYLFNTLHHQNTLYRATVPSQAERAGASSSGVTTGYTPNTTRQRQLGVWAEQSTNELGTETRSRPRP